MELAYRAKVPPGYVHSAERDDFVPPDKTLFHVDVDETCGESSSYDVKQFYWQRVKPDFTIVLDGQRRAGKSTWLRAMMQQTRSFWAEVYVFTGTPSSYEYQDIVRNDCIFDNLDSREDGTGGMDLLTRIYFRNLGIKAKMMECGENKQNINTLIIIEDLAANEQSNRGFHNIPLFNKIAFNGRHAHLAFVVTSQNIKAIPPAIKQNTDLSVLFGLNSHRTKETVRENFMAWLRNDRQLDQLVAFVYEMEWMFLAIDRSNPRIDPRETIFAGRPHKAEKDFVMGNREYWMGAEAQLHCTGFGYLLDLPPEEWGIEPVTYGVNLKNALHRPC